MINGRLPTLRLVLISFIFIAQLVLSRAVISSEPEMEIHSALARYAETERQKDLNAHMDLYGDTINFYGELISKEELKNKFAPLFNKSQTMEMEIDNINITFISNDHAVAMFNKYFRFLGKPGKNDFCGEVIAAHELKNIDEKWLTVAVKESSVLWVEKKDCNNISRKTHTDKVRPKPISKEYSNLVRRNTLKIKDHIELCSSGLESYDNDELRAFYILGLSFPDIFTIDPDAMEDIILSAALANIEDARGNIQIEWAIEQLGYELEWFYPAWQNLSSERRATMELKKRFKYSALGFLEVSGDEIRALAILGITRKNVYDDQPEDLEKVIQTAAKGSPEQRWAVEILGYSLSWY